MNCSNLNVFHILVWHWGVVLLTSGPALFALAWNTSSGGAGSRHLGSDVAFGKGFSPQQGRRRGDYRSGEEKAARGGLTGPLALREWTVRNPGLVAAGGLKSRGKKIRFSQELAFEGTRLLNSLPPLSSRRASACS